MATTKNITMKQFNGTDYDTLYPKTKLEQVEGAYTQQQILADSTKTLYGLDATAVPDDAFKQVISISNWYVWDKVTPGFTYTETARTSGDNYTLLFTASGSSAHFRISDTLQDALSGVYTEQDVTPANRATLNGKYVRTDTVLYGNQPSAYEYIFYIAPNATWSIYTNPNGYCFSTGTVYSDIEATNIHQTYVSSPDANAYPVSDDYIALGQLGDALSRAKIAKGSYTGTGTYGVSNPCSLTFSFVPEIVIITKNGARYGYGQQEPSAVSLFNGQTSFSAAYNGTASLLNTVSWGTTVSWYISGYVPGDAISVAPNLQLNTSSETYYYIAIG